ncbi:chromatin associated protein KTI12 [Ephemerocybe angulata]|uniref:Chromatin associated protein KTI12 n=1 Tax=Ephemerocybe angulata TaxID=980116 RepID=A0A8H6I7G1_9AGAR|nr:chromatin associated protein KTI12 [Tulosesus angulatus]
MALVTISGYPSAGKSTRVAQIQAYLQQRLDAEDYAGPKLSVEVLSDDVLNLERSVYNDSRSEKPARGALFTAMQRQMSTDKILIVDSLNYIKGFRYQMYCAAREMKLRVCTVHVVAAPDVCREWNANRKDGRTYSTETFENLIMRYEEPSSMVRWDSPLFSILWLDTEIPGEQIWDALTKGVVKPPNGASLSVAKAPTDALHTLEQTTAGIVSQLFSEASGSSSGGKVVIAVSEGVKVDVTLPPRNITLAELQRLKRQFVTIHKKAITLGSTEKGRMDWSEESIGSKFSTFLGEHL